MRFIAAAAFISTIPAANWLIGNVGTECIPSGPCLLPVGFGLMAPSGVVMIGVALVLRDWLHEIAGWKWSVGCVLAGGLLSLAVAPAEIAFASAVAFTVAEMADLAIYTPLRKRGLSLAVVASGIVGAIVDSSVFVWLAFGSLDLSVGTALAKIYASVIVALILHRKAKHANS